MLIQGGLSVKIKSVRFGEIEANSDNTWTFASPILGFESFKTFVHLTQTNSPFEFIQSVNDENLAFVVADPFQFEANYEFSLDQRWLDILNIQTKDQVLVRSIVTVRSSADITMNLKAPLVINLKTKEAAQIILDRPEFNTRHSIFNANQREVSHVDIVEK